MIVYVYSIYKIIEGLALIVVAGFIPACSSNGTNFLAGINPATTNERFHSNWKIVHDVLTIIYGTQHFWAKGESGV
jgi:uncharacterized membrane protein